MKFSPNVAQLCLIAELSHAKAPVEAIAKAVKLSPRAFRAWQAWAVEQFFERPEQA
jgi:hypothetical protein